MERWRSFGVTVRPASNAFNFVTSRETGEVHLMSGAHVGLLRSCTSLGSLDEHALRFLRVSTEEAIRTGGGVLRSRLKKWAVTLIKSNQELFFTGIRDLVEINEAIQDLIERDLIISEDHLRDRVIDGCKRLYGHSEDRAIRSICIPTTCRPNCLSRLVESVIEHCITNSRSPDIVISADSSSSNHTQGCDLVAMQSRYPGKILYADRARRAWYAKQLSDETGVDEKLVRYALLGADGLSVTHGANRNSMLIHTVGAVSMQIDDDLVCDLVTHPQVRDSLAIGVYDDPNDYTYVTDRSFFDELPVAGNADLIGVHAALIGRNVQRVVLEHCLAGGELDVSKMSWELLEMIRTSTMSIVATQCGAFGDSGMREEHNVTRLFESSASQLSLQTGDDFFQLVNTRDLFRASARTVLSQTGPLMAMNICLDGQGPLPPFPPSYRNEDSVFAAVLRACFPAAIIGTLPYALRHAPPVVRSHSESICETHGSCERPRMNDILMWLILWASEGGFRGYESDNMASLGHSLVRVANQPVSSFRSLVDSVGLDVISHTLQARQAFLSTAKGAGDDWRKCAQKQMEILEAEATSRDFFTPHDVPGTASERITILKDEIRNYGEILENWPALLEAALKLRWRNISLALPVGEVCK